MDIRHIRSVLAIAEELSFRRAAQKCRVAQPALSRTIADLEHDLGVRLFDRSRNHVALTPAGAKFVQCGRRVLREIEHLRAATQREGRAAGGLRVGAMMAEYLRRGPVATALRQLQRSVPGANVTVQEVLADGVMRAVRNGSVDVGIAFTPLAGSARGLAVDVLYQETLVAAVPATDRRKRCMKGRPSVPGTRGA
jgi:DNA-binding transcriptional LysR family regulator